MCADVDFSPKTFNLIFPYELFLFEMKKNRMGRDVGSFQR